MIAELVKHHCGPGTHPIWQRLSLLVFIPTIHRTTSHVVASFPSLARDDVSQHTLAAFLEFLQSAELRARHSHIAFAVARALRRKTFRWAIHEARSAMTEETDPAMTAEADDVLVDDGFSGAFHLQQFLDSCQRNGWLSVDERVLLTLSKIEGLSCSEIARRNGHTAVAIKRRIQRLLDRLRRVAGDADRRLPRQLELFTK
jgi:DNA-directed RNA polymerase specialized sigma24 family protein